MKIKVRYTIARTKTLEVTPKDYRRFQANPELLKPLVNAPKTRSCINAIQLVKFSDFVELIQAKI